MATHEICLQVNPGADLAQPRPGSAVPSDHELMVSVRDGRLDAMGEIYERHSAALLGFLRRYTGQPSAADDILQTVFLRMLRYRHTYRSDGRFAPWMYRLARHAAADHCRKMPPPPSPDAVTDEQRDPVPHAADKALAADDHALLQSALARLREDDREILLLSRIRELSYAEIADVLECSVGAAKVRAHRALVQLRAIYLELQKPSLP